MSDERQDGERGDGEGAGSQATLCACASEERGHGEMSGASLFRKKKSEHFKQCT